MFAHLALGLAGALGAATGPVTVPTAPGEGALTPFERALDRVPADLALADGALLTYVDMDLAWDRAGVGDDPEERMESIGSLVALPTYTQAAQLFGPMAMRVDEARAEVGFSMFDIEREVAVLAPPRNVFVVEVAASPDDVVAAVETDPLWSSDLRVVETAAGSYFQWGDDPLEQHLDRLSPMRQLGQGGTLAVLGDGDEGTTVVRALDAASVEGVLETIDGTSGSLLDGGGSIAAGVEALADEGDVLQAVAAQPGPFAPPLVDSPEQMEAIVDQMVLLQPYLGVMIAELYDGDESRTQVLLLHLSDEAAERNAALAEQALAEGFDPYVGEPLADLLPGAEVSTEGSVVVVDLPFEGAFPRATQMLQTRALFPTE